MKALKDGIIKAQIDILKETLGRIHLEVRGVAQNRAYSYAWHRTRFLDQQLRDPAFENAPDVGPVLLGLVKPSPQIDAVLQRRDKQEFRLLLGEVL